MGGDNPMRTHICPACGRPMDLTRTIPAGPGYSELRTHATEKATVLGDGAAAPIGNNTVPYAALSGSQSVADPSALPCDQCVDRRDDGLSPAAFIPPQISPLVE